MLLLNVFLSKVNKKCKAKSTYNFGKKHFQSNKLIQC